MADVESCAQRVDLMLAGRSALAQTEEPIGEFLAVIGQNGADAQRASTFQVT